MHGENSFFPQSYRSVLLDTFHQPRVINPVEELKSQEILVALTKQTPALSTLHSFQSPPVFASCLPCSDSASLAACASLLEAGDPGSGHPSTWAGTGAISQQRCPNQGIFLGVTQFLFLGLSNGL